MERNYLKLIFAFVLTISSITLIYADKANAKKSSNGRTEYYDYDYKANSSATEYEYLALGAECTVAINMKGNSGEGIADDYKDSRMSRHTAKLKGTKGSKTGDDVCSYAQKYSYFNINYHKYINEIVFYSTNKNKSYPMYGAISHQGYKMIFDVPLKNSKMIKKYRKLGLMTNNSKNIKIIVTARIKNPKSLKKYSHGKKYEYKITQNYVRTPSISSKNVVMNNVTYDDGSDTLTVKGLKKGTRLNVYNGFGQLYKSVKVNGTSYKITVPRNKDLTTEFKSSLSKNKADKIILSRTEPNKFESYRLQYKIPKEKPAERTPSGNNSNIRELGTASASISVFDALGQSQVSIQFQSLIGNKEGIYRIKYDGKEVYKFHASSSDYSDLDNGDYLYFKEFSNDAQAVNIFKNLKPKNLEDAKKYTITAQIEGMKESLPVPFYVSNSEKKASQIGFDMFIED